MNNTQVSKGREAKKPMRGPVEIKVDVLPVADVERSKRFYEGLGWRLDADFVGPGVRGVQLTPPGSPASIIFGRGITDAVPGSVQGLFLVVEDIEAARADLIARGVDVSEVFHFAGGIRVDSPEGRLKGPDPEGKSYSSWASFKDPDGNGWLLQEVKTRLPGRGLSNETVPTLTALLREAEQRHGAFESTAPKHHWSEWYAAYIVARERGKTPDEAASEAARHMKTPRA